MRIISVNVGRTNIVFDNCMWSGYESIYANGRLVSKEFSFFGVEHFFEVEEDGEWVDYEVRTGFGWNGITADVYRNGVCLVKDGKSGLDLDIGINGDIYYKHTTAPTMDGMRIISLNVGQTNIVFDNCMWSGNEMIYLNGELISKKFSFFGKNHVFEVEEDGVWVTYRVKTGFGWVGVKADVYRNEICLIKDGNSGLHLDIDRPEKELYGTSDLV